MKQVIKTKVNQRSYISKQECYHSSDYGNEYSVWFTNTFDFYFSLPLGKEELSLIFSNIHISEEEDYREFYQFIPKGVEEATDCTDCFIDQLNQLFADKRFIEGEMDSCPYRISLNDQQLYGFPEKNYYSFHIHNVDFIKTAPLNDILIAFDYCFSHSTSCFVDVIAKRLYNESVKEFIIKAKHLLQHDLKTERDGYHLFDENGESWHYSCNFSQIIDALYEIAPNILYEFLEENSLFQSAKDICCFGLVSPCTPWHITLFPSKFRNRMRDYHEQCHQDTRFGSMTEERSVLYLKEIDSFINEIREDLEQRIGDVYQKLASNYPPIDIW